jgi:hypothetical protein
MVRELLHTGSFRAVAQALDRDLVEAHVVQRLHHDVVVLRMDPRYRALGLIKSAQSGREGGRRELLQPLAGQDPDLVSG